MRILIRKLKQSDFDSWSDLWEQYSNLEGNVTNFKVGKIKNNTEIWDVFKDFFKKKVKS